MKRVMPLLLLLVVCGCNAPRILAGMSVDVTVNKHRHEKEGRRARLEFITLEAASR